MNQTFSLLLVSGLAERSFECFGGLQSWSRRQRGFWLMLVMACGSHRLVLMFDRQDRVCDVPVSTSWGLFDPDTVCYTQVSHGDDVMWRNASPRSSADGQCLALALAWGGFITWVVTAVSRVAWTFCLLLVGSMARIWIFLMNEANSLCFHVKSPDLKILIEINPNMRQYHTA